MGAGAAASESETVPVGDSVVVPVVVGIGEGGVAVGVVDGEGDAVPEVEPAGVPDVDGVCDAISDGDGSATPAQPVASAAARFSPPTPRARYPPVARSRRPV